MITKIVILILWCLAGFLIGSFVVPNNTKSVLNRGINVEDVSLDIECESGICPPMEEKKEK